MSRHRLKIYVAITVVLAAVILLWWTLTTWFGAKNTEAPVTNVVSEEKVIRDPLSGQKLSEPFHDFLVAVMLDNGYDVRPQYGLAKADIIYEALAESNITRLMAIYHGQDRVDKVGPVRSARPYFLDWAQEYQSVYMHVGGSPDALAGIDRRSIENVDQIGAGEIYFWRDTKLKAPHNVFTSSANWLRVAELRNLPKLGQNIIAWNFSDSTSTASTHPDLTINYNDIYKVEWRYNQNLGFYQRWQGDEKFVYDDGEQARADNVLVQIIPSKVLDEQGRREMNTRARGSVLLFNKRGTTKGYWQKDSERTIFFDEQNKEMVLVPGKTWVQIVDSLDLVKY